MSNAQRIARLESLLATVTRRAAEPRPARGAAVTAASNAATTAAPARAPVQPTPAPVQQAAPQAPAPAVPEAAARKPRGVDPRAEPEPEASTQHNRPTAPPPAEAASMPDLEFSMSSAAQGLAASSASVSSARDSEPEHSPSGEFEIRSHSAPAVPARRSSPPPANVSSMALDLDVGPASDVSDMEVDHAPLAVHANSVMPPSGAVPSASVRIAAQPIPLDLSSPSDEGEPESERFAAPLLGDPDAVVYTDLSPSGPPTFRALLLRSLSLRAR